MIGLRSLRFLTVLVVFFICGLRPNAEVAGYIKKDIVRADTEPDEFATTFEEDQTRATSTLFSSCLPPHTAVEAIFKSIELDSGDEYIRYVPDSSQTIFTLDWRMMDGAFPTIFECMEAAYDADWPVFKFDGAECKVSPSGYGWDYAPGCDADDSDAVFMLSTARFICAPPKFLMGYDDTDAPICGYVSAELMTFDEAWSHCLNMYPNNELSLYDDDFPGLTFADMVANLTSLDYTSTNLWVLAGEGSTWSCLSGNFDDSDWLAGGPPPCDSDVRDGTLAVYMDAENDFKLVAQDKSLQAGVLCANYKIYYEGF